MKAILPLLAFSLAAPAAFAHADPKLEALHKQVTAQHDANVQRLKDWIALPSIAAENLNYPQGADYMARSPATCSSTTWPTARRAC